MSENGPKQLSIIEFGSDEIAAIHHSDQTVFNVSEMLANAEQSMTGVKYVGERALSRVVRIEAIPEIQLELI